MARNLQTIARLTEYVTTQTGDGVDVYQLPEVPTKKKRGPKRAGSIVALRTEKNTRIQEGRPLYDWHPSLSPLKKMGFALR